MAQQCSKKYKQRQLEKFNQMYMDFVTECIENTDLYDDMMEDIIQHSVCDISMMAIPVDIYYFFFERVSLKKCKKIAKKYRGWILLNLHKYLIE